MRDGVLACRLALLVAGQASKFLEIRFFSYDCTGSLLSVGLQFSFSNLEEGASCVETGICRFTAYRLLIHAVFENCFPSFRGGTRPFFISSPLYFHTLTLILFYSVSFRWSTRSLRERHAGPYLASQHCHHVYKPHTNHEELGGPLSCHILAQHPKPCAYLCCCGIWRKVDGNGGQC